MRISVCIPMYNESKIIKQTAQTLAAYMDKTFGTDYEIVFCDDGSTDGSAGAVSSLGLERVRVVGYEKNRGKGYAVRTALLESKGDVALFTDADLAYGPDVIARFEAAFRSSENPDVLVGTRNKMSDGYSGYTLVRKIVSKIYIKVLCIVGGLRLSDSQCGCKAFTREAIEKIFPRCVVDRFAFDFEAILWAQKLGLRMGEIPVKVLVHGESKVRIVRDSIRMMFDLLKMRIRIKRAKV